VHIQEDRMLRSRSAMTKNGRSSYWENTPQAGSQEAALRKGPFFAYCAGKPERASVSPQSDRSTQLRRQRALVAEHLYWTRSANSREESETSAAPAWTPPAPRLLRSRQSGCVRPGLACARKAAAGHGPNGPMQLPPPPLANPRRCSKNQRRPRELKDGT